MKVCMLVWSYWPLPTGGAEAQCRKLAAELKGLNVSCCVLTAWQRPGDLGRELDQGLAIRRLFVPQWLVACLTAQNKPYAPKTPSDSVRVPAPSGSRLVFTFLPWLLRFANCLFFMAGAGLHMWWNRNNYDVLHVPNADWIAGYAGVLGAVYRKPVLCKAANMPPLKPLASWVPFRKILEEKRRKIHFVALHKSMRDALIIGGVSAESISLIPNGVVLPEEKADPGRMNHVLCGANFTQGAGHKGFDWLLKSWARVVERCPEARLCLAGDGDSSEWRAMAEDLGIESSVTFPGFIANHRDLYASATLLVVPSRHEGVPNVLLEAQAWGLPAVVSDIPGNSLVVQDGVTGLIVPVDDVEALTAALVEMLLQPSQRRKMGKAAREKMRSCFSMSGVAKAYHDCYRSILGDHFAKTKTFSG